MKASFPAAAAALLLAGSPALAEPCTGDTLGADAVRINNGGLTIAYRTEPEEIRVGKPFSVEVIACEADGEAPEAISLDAGMPAHGHGMNYAPSMRKLGPGHAAFDGLVFHMPGSWAIRFEVTAGGKRMRVVQPVTIRR